MIENVIYATVIYDCENFEVFLDDYLNSVFSQTDQNFKLLILIDDADEYAVRDKVNKLNKKDLGTHIFLSDGNMSPVKLRQRLVELSYQLNANVLIFSDFDETVTSNRVEEINKKIHKYSFVFNDFYIVDRKLNKMDENSFFNNRDIPDEITDWRSIQSFNYIGLGSIALNLAKFDYRNMVFPSDLQALDWFIATKVLLENGNGSKLDTTYANYRQHESSFVGFDFKLDKIKLNQGLNIKKQHYGFFRKFNDKYEALYNDILKLEIYIHDVGEELYINEVNSMFDTSKFCWWENIKLVNEINHDI